MEGSEELGVLLKPVASPVIFTHLFGSFLIQPPIACQGGRRQSNDDVGSS